MASIYACGITPYDATHIGHAATYIAWDLLIRSWRDAGHGVLYAQNITDVDDPLLERAARDGDDWRELADREIDRFRSDMTALRLLPPDYFVGAVEALDVIEDFAGVLADRGSLYDLDGDVYFCRSADPEFGSVSGLGTQQMIELSAERGGDPGRPGKKDPLDPLVWMGKRPGEPSWGSRFGPGRPGWHVECSAIATRYLGRAFDVQAGGSDLIFPHHEMSASHARVAFGTADGGAFARRYAHAGMVRFGGEKMSKSLGNLVFVSALRESGTDPMAIRLAILAHHYRQDWDWTQEGLTAAAERLRRWRAAVQAAAPASAQVPERAETMLAPLTAPKPDSGVPDGALAPRAAGATVGAAASAGGSAAASAGGSAAGGAGGGAAGGAGGAGAGAGLGTATGAAAVLAGIRERLADDLDAPGALAIVDRWAEEVLTGRAALPVGSSPAVPLAGSGPAVPPTGSGPAAPPTGSRPAAPPTAEEAGLIRDAVDALLGIAL